MPGYARNASFTTESYGAREFRLLISSTIRDMPQEREYLIRDVFPEIRALCDERGVGFTVMDPLLELTKQQVREGMGIARYLDEINRHRPYYVGIVGPRYGWIPDIEDFERHADILERYPRVRRAVCDRQSIVEIEIINGIVKNPIMHKKSSFYFLDPACGRDMESDDPTHVKRKLLEEKIRLSGIKAAASSSDFHHIAAQIQHDLRYAIDSRFPVDGPMLALDRERRAHEAFAESRRKAYVPNRATIEYLDRFVVSDGPPLIIVGESGAGKSALLAYWSEKYRKENPDAFVITHHVGATASGGDPVMLLRRIMLEIRDRYNIEEELPLDSRRIVELFPRWLANIRQKPLLLVIDALNQLGEKARVLSWLPEYIQPQVRLIVSTTYGDVHETLRDRKWSEFKVLPLSVAERGDVITAILKSTGKKFNSEQISNIAKDPGSANPLFLRIGLEELDAHTGDEGLKENIDYYLHASGLDELFDRVLTRLEQEYGRKLVRGVMTSIWASHRGLSNEELAGILGVDLPVLQKLFHALEHHLLRRDGLATFFHDHLRQGVERRYVAGARDVAAVRRSVTGYFSRQPVSSRMVDELSWQLHAMKRWDKLALHVGSIEVFRQFIIEEKKYELLGYWNALGEKHDIVVSYTNSLKKYEKGCDQNELGFLLHEFGQFLCQSGRYGAAEEICRRAFNVREAYLGTSHAETIESLDSLATVYYFLNRYQEAGELIERSLHLKQKTFGDRYRSTVKSLSDLGAIAHALGKFDEAEELMRRAVEIYRNTIGNNHPEAISASNNLAATLREKKDYVGAVTTLLETLAVNNRHGRDRVETAINYINLGVVYKLMGDLESAERYYNDGHLLLEKLLGKYHPEVARCLSNLAALYKDMVNTEASERLYREALDIREKMLGDDHLDTHNSRLNLASLLIDLGRCQEAMDLFMISLPAKRRILGPDHPSTVQSENKFKELLRKMRGDDEESDEPDL